MSRAFAFTVILLAATFGICVVRYAPPPARGPGTPPSEFSAARAREIQRAIAGDGAARTIGSEAHARARTLLQAALTGSGWKAELQSAMSCSRHGACARVTNILASRAGREPTATSVLLMAHYDSVTCSPGAADDGFGTAAVVETARAIAAGPPLQRNVLVVLTDGEESGLLGAEAFVREHPLARTVGRVVNIDSRGSNGASAMFETSPGNARIVTLLARHLDRPVTSSLFYEVYRRMPNDTDFTVLKGRAQGVNFANIGGVERYHTSSDSLENADARTLQHHGDQALAMVRAFADIPAHEDPPQKLVDDAVWFDVLAMFIVRWPTSAALALALVALSLVAGWTLRMRPWRSGARGLVAPVAALVGAGLGAAAVGRVLQAAGALPVPWVAHPLAASVALHGTAFVCGLGAARLVAGRQATAHSLWAGTWLIWGGIGVGTAVATPGASFLFVVPTLAAGIFGWLRIDVAAAIPALVAGVVWLPLVLLVYEGIGFAVPLAACLASVMLASTLPALWISPAPLGSPARMRAFTAFALGAALLVAVLVPRFSVAVPQRVNVVFRQDDAESAPPARVFVEAAWAFVPWGIPPEPMVRALGERARVRLDAPWAWSPPLPAIDVPRVPLAAPKAVTNSSIVTGAGWTKHVRLTSSRGARTIALVVPRDAAMTIAIDGQTAILRRDTLVLRGVPDEGVDVAFTHVGLQRVVLTILDATPGLPIESSVARGVREARPAAAVQTQEGDVTIATTSLEL